MIFEIRQFKYKDSIIVYWTNSIYFNKHKTIELRQRMRAGRAWVLCKDVVTP